MLKTLLLSLEILGYIVKVIFYFTKLFVVIMLAVLVVGLIGVSYIKAACLMFGTNFFSVTIMALLSVGYLYKCIPVCWDVIKDDLQTAVQVAMGEITPGILLDRVQIWRLELQEEQRQLELAE